MNILAQLIGMSVDIGPIGSLLAGALSKNLKRAAGWVVFWAVLQAVVGALVDPIADPFIFLRFLLCVFWGCVGWFLIGRARSKRSKTSLIPGDH